MSMHLDMRKHVYVWALFAFWSFSECSLDYYETLTTVDVANTVQVVSTFQNLLNLSFEKVLPNFI